MRGHSPGKEALPPIRPARSTPSHRLRAREEPVTKSSSARVLNNQLPEVHCSSPCSSNNNLTAWLSSLPSKRTTVKASQGCPWRAVSHQRDPMMVNESTTTSWWRAQEPCIRRNRDETAAMRGHPSPSETSSTPTSSKTIKKCIICKNNEITRCLQGLWDRRPSAR